MFSHAHQLVETAFTAEAFEMDVGLLVNPPLDEFEDEYEHDKYSESFYPKWNCNQIRTKLNAFVNSGAMRVGELQKELQVNLKGYLLFMRQNGPHAGSGSNTYHNAHIFFARREEQGLKISKPKKAPAGTDTDAKYNVDGIDLPVDATGNVEIYDTCDNI